MLIHYSDIAFAIQVVYAFPFIIECGEMIVMDTTNPVIQLCIQGTRAEFEHRREDAHGLYLQAWAASTDNHEACIAAHYVARFQETPQESLQWNQIALDRAMAVNDERVTEFYPSLYLPWDVRMRSLAIKTRHENILNLPHRWALSAA